MGGKNNWTSRYGIVIDYDVLETISIDEFLHAFIADIKTLKDIHNVRFVTASRLRIYPTDEHGDEVALYRPGGTRVFKLYPAHYRPACKEYEL